MRLPRLLAAAAAVVGVAALSGCLVLPTTAPIATPGPPAVPVSTEEVPDAVPGDASNTVDDGAGDIWTYTLVDVELPTTLATGTPPPGMQPLALVLDATHDEGYASWGTCFDVYVVTDEGSWSTLDDASQGLEAIDDRTSSLLSFTQGRVVIAVPDELGDLDDATIVIASAFGDDARSFEP